MSRKPFLFVGLAVAVSAAAVFTLGRDRGPIHYTGFVEGEERVLRSEVFGRVLEVRFAEGETVPADAVVATLDDRDVASRLKSKQQEIAVLESDIRAQEERIRLTESTWKRDLSAREADLRQAESAAGLADRSFVREKSLAETGASTAQLLDDARSRRDQAQSALERVRQMLARTQAEERTITLARAELDMLHRKHDLALAQLAELEVAQAKTVIRSPATPTVVQTQYLWPGELAQPGSALLSVLDPKDKYVQIYVPVADLERVRVGQTVEIELDSRPDRRIPGEIQFIAEKASFTPEKIETRSDRLGQVYRAKVRVLEGAELLQPGTEGDVYLIESTARHEPAGATG